MSDNALPTLADQAERLIELGVDELAQRSPAELRAAARAEVDGAVLVVHPSLAPASALASLLRHDDKAGFVVVDMADVDEFLPI